MFDVQAELKRLPNRPGVYIMRDEDDVVIYVGKAINLKNRVRSYFQASNDNDPKVRGIRFYIRRFEYIVVDTEVEALILENNLIKRYMPRFNVMLKDDKSYPYIKVTVKDPFPRMFATRQFDRDKSRYFGPYTSKYAVDETLELMHTLWPLRRCHKPIKAGGRPCLNYHIGRCSGPCGGRISAEDYGKLVADALDFLGGNYGPVVKQLEADMAAASEALDFEKAAKQRDKILAIRALQQKQHMDQITTGDQDVFAFDRNETDAMAQVFFMRGGKMTGREHFLLQGEQVAAGGISDAELMSEVVSRFYAGTPLIPKEILLQTETPDDAGLERQLSALKGGAVKVSAPRRGERAQITRLARENAALMLAQFGEQMKREYEKTEGALSEIQKALAIETRLTRIEAYDISNVQGFESVGSMVVFEDGKARRGEYRKFKIKTVKGANDAASMDEVLTRRFTRYLAEANEAKSKFNKLPDALFMDGGKPQVSAALEALARLGLTIPVVGMVKDDRHRTRAMLYLDTERKMPYTSEGFKLLTRIQDEVHRFAIEYHRKLRKAAQTRSVLDDIPGIGPARRAALVKAFRSVDRIRAANQDELAAADGMTKTAAAAVFRFFHSTGET